MKLTAVASYGLMRVLYRAVSSAVEHCLHTAGVTGSIPVPPTIETEHETRTATGFAGFLFFGFPLSSSVQFCSVPILCPNRAQG